MSVTVCRMDNSCYIVIFCILEQLFCLLLSGFGTGIIQGNTTLGKLISPSISSVLPLKSISIFPVLGAAKHSSLCKISIQQTSKKITTKTVLNFFVLVLIFTLFRSPLLSAFCIINDCSNQNDKNNNQCDNQDFCDHG